MLSGTESSRTPGGGTPAKPNIKSWELKRKGHPKEQDSKFPVQEWKRQEGNIGEEDKRNVRTMAVEQVPTHGLQSHCLVHFTTSQNFVRTIARKIKRVVTHDLEFCGLPPDRDGPAALPTVDLWL